MSSKQQTWFYDIDVYYDYVLLNTSFNVFEKIQNALRKDGVRVLKAAKSFRPASNDIQYNWYIRIEDENSETPSRERVETIVHSVIDIDAIGWKSQIVLLQTKIDELQDSLNQRNNEFEKVSSQLDFAKKERNQFSVRLKRTKAHFEKNQEEIENLNKKLDGLFKPDDIEALKKQYEHRVKEKDIQLDEIKSEYDDFIADYEQFMHDYEKKDGEITDLKNQIFTLQQEKSTLYKKHSAELEEALKANKFDRSEKLSTSIVETLLLPNVVFLRSSIKFMWMEFDNKAIVDILSCIKNLKLLQKERKSWLVKGVPNTRWNEYHKSDVWRIYFQKCENGKYEVLVSDKDTQEKRDWDWLKRQQKC